MMTTLTTTIVIVFCIGYLCIALFGVCSCIYDWLYSVAAF